MQDLSSRVDATANRLRLLQIEFADASAEERRKYLANEIAEVLKSILPEQRRDFLRELETRFPTWDIRKDAAPATSSVPSEAPAEINDWTFLLEHLLRVSPGLSPQDRDALIERLVEAGLAPQVETEWPVSVEKDLRKRLRLGEGQPISAERVLRLTGLLAEFAGSLETTWDIWKQIEPRSEIKKSADLRKSLADYVAGKDDVGVKQEVDRLRTLIASLLNAVKFFSEQIAQKYLDELAPETVKQVARQKKWAEPAQVPWWEKYEELAWGPDRETIARRMRQVVADSARIFLKGLS